MITHYFPRLRSFRIRIALLSTALSATVLIAFGLWTWLAVQRTGLRRIDENIRELGGRRLNAPQGPEHWQNMEKSLEFVLGDLMYDPFFLLVIGRDGEVLFRSVTWPVELSEDAFPTPAEAGFIEKPDYGRPFRDRERGPARFDEPPRRGVQSENNSPNRPRQGPPRPHEPPPPLPVHSQNFLTTHTGPNIWRVGVMSNPEATLVLGLNLRPYTAEMDRLWRLFLLATPAVLVLVALSGWWLAQRALRPVLALTNVAEGITAHALDQRIPMTKEDAEFGRLIRVFNGMLDRLEKSFEQAVRFSADAAHELKTPLTILQGELAQAVQSASPGSEQQQTLSRLMEEVQRLKAITRKLLLLSLADSGQLKPQVEPVNISELVQAVDEDIRILAPNLHVKESISDGLWVNADRDLLQQVIQNLTSNAVKYNVPDGSVTIELREESGYIRFTIANTGPTIPVADRDRIFERFYRADKARNRSVDGVGLGLSLAREIVRAHHGDLVIENTRDAQTAFTMMIPAGRSPA